jgi:hypothetical protein
MKSKEKNTIRRGLTFSKYKILRGIARFKKGGGRVSFTVPR